MKRAILSAAILLSACATAPVNDAGAPGAAGIPSAPIELGDWRSASEAETGAAFEQQVGARYARGVAISAVRADLRRNDFACAPNTTPSNGRGDPPNQICRKSATAGNCTHTWQVHLFETGDVLERARAIYDRRCGNDGLLGGPGR